MKRVLTLVALYFIAIAALPFVISGMGETSDTKIIKGKSIIIDHSVYKCKMVKTLKDIKEGVK